ALVIAGLGDMTRPAEKLSVRQSAALCATGFIWSRYSLVIIPKNYSLFAVNFFVGLTGASQLGRIAQYIVSGYYVQCCARKCVTHTQKHQHYLFTSQRAEIILHGEKYT
ncbi:unnamed protein product, partial [Candidula unifasciata]